MRDALKAYLSLATSLTEVTRQRAVGAAKALVSQGEATAEQVTALAEDLVAQSKANREAVSALVKFEVDRGLGRVGLASADEVGELATRLHALEGEVRRLTSAGRSGSSAGGASAPVDEALARKAGGTPVVPDGGSGAEAALTEEAPATAPARTPAVAQAAPERTPGRTTAKQAPAKNAPAEQAPAKQAAAKKTPAKKTPAKKTPAKRTPAEQAPATRALGKGARAGKGSDRSSGPNAASRTQAPTEIPGADGAAGTPVETVPRGAAPMSDGAGA